MDESKSKRDHRIEAVKGYLLAAFPDAELRVKAHDGDLSWHIQVVRAHQVVHEARILRRFLDDEDSNADPVAVLTLWSLAPTMKMNGTNPVTVSKRGLST
jgi:hypothetical protein